MDGVDESQIQVKLETFGIEKFSQDGVNRNIHLVSKTHSFQILLFSKEHNLENASFLAELFYDGDSVEKLVQLSKSSPLSYKAIALSKEEALIEARIHVLSSQHQDSFFRIKITVKLDSEKICTVLTEAIRALSKTSLIPKLTGQSMVGQKRKSFISTPTTTTTSNDGDILNLIRELQEQQIQQRKALELLLQDRMVDNHDHFEFAFISLMKAFHNLSPEERSSKVQKVLLTAPSHLLHEFFQIFQRYENYTQVPKCETPILEFSENTNHLEDFYTALFAN